MEKISVLWDLVKVLKAWPKIKEYDIVDPSILEFYGM